MTANIDWLALIYSGRAACDIIGRCVVSANGNLIRLPVRLIYVQ